MSKEILLPTDTMVFFTLEMFLHDSVGHDFNPSSEMARKRALKAEAEMDAALVAFNVTSGGKNIQKGGASTEEYLLKREEINDFYGKTIEKMLNYGRIKNSIYIDNANSELLIIDWEVISSTSGYYTGYVYTSGKTYSPFDLILQRPQYDAADGSVSVSYVFVDKDRSIRIIINASQCVIQSSGEVKTFTRRTNGPVISQILRNIFINNDGNHTYEQIQSYMSTLVLLKTTQNASLIYDFLKGDDNNFRRIIENGLRNLQSNQVLGTTLIQENIRKEFKAMVQNTIRTTSTPTIHSFEDPIRKLKEYLLSLEPTNEDFFGNFQKFDELINQIRYYFEALTICVKYFLLNTAVKQGWLDNPSGTLGEVLTNILPKFVMEKCMDNGKQIENIISSFVLQVNMRGDLKNNKHRWGFLYDLELPNGDVMSKVSAEVNIAANPDKYRVCLQPRCVREDQYLFPHQIQGKLPVGAHIIRKNPGSESWEPDSTVVGDHHLDIQKESENEAYRMWLEIQSLTAALAVQPQLQEQLNQARQQYLHFASAAFGQLMAEYCYLSLRLISIDRISDYDQYNHTKVLGMDEKKELENELYQYLQIQPPPLGPEQGFIELKKKVENIRNKYPAYYFFFPSINSSEPFKYSQSLNQMYGLNKFKLSGIIAIARFTPHYPELDQILETIDMEASQLGRNDDDINSIKLYSRLGVIGGGPNIFKVSKIINFLQNMLNTYVMSKEEHDPNIDYEENAAWEAWLEKKDEDGADENQILFFEQPLELAGFTPDEIIETMREEGKDENLLLVNAGFTSNEIESLKTKGEYNNDMTLVRAGFTRNEIQSLKTKGEYNDYMTQVRAGFTREHIKTRKQDNILNGLRLGVEFNNCRIAGKEFPREWILERRDQGHEKAEMKKELENREYQRRWEQFQKVLEDEWSSIVIYYDNKFRKQQEQQIFRQEQKQIQLIMNLLTQMGADEDKVYSVLLDINRVNSKGYIYYMMTQDPITTLNTTQFDPALQVLRKLKQNIFVYLRRHWDHKLPELRENLAMLKTAQAERRQKLKDLHESFIEQQRNIYMQERNTQAARDARIKLVGFGGDDGTWVDFEWNEEANHRAEAELDGPFKGGGLGGHFKGGLKFSKKEFIYNPKIVKVLLFEELKIAATRVNNRKPLAEVPYVLGKNLSILGKSPPSQPETTQSVYFEDVSTWGSPQWFINYDKLYTVPFLPPAAGMAAPDPETLTLEMIKGNKSTLESIKEQHQKILNSLLTQTTGWEDARALLKPDTKGEINFFLNNTSGQFYTFQKDYIYMMVLFTLLLVLEAQQWEQLHGRKVVYITRLPSRAGAASIAITSPPDNQQIFIQRFISYIQAYISLVDRAIVIIDQSSNTHLSNVQKMVIGYSLGAILASIKTSLTAADLLKNHSSLVNIELDMFNKVLELHKTQNIRTNMRSGITSDYDTKLYKNFIKYIALHPPYNVNFMCVDSRTDLPCEPDISKNMFEVLIQDKGWERGGVVQKMLDASKDPEEAKKERFWISNACSARGIEYLNGNFFCNEAQIADNQSTCSTTKTAMKKEGLEWGTIDVVIHDGKSFYNGGSVSKSNIVYRIRAVPVAQRGTTPTELRISAYLKVGEQVLINISDTDTAPPDWPSQPPPHDPIVCPLDAKGGIIPMDATTCLKNILKTLTGRPFKDINSYEDLINILCDTTGRGKAENLRRILIESSFVKGLGDFLQEINGVTVNSGYVDGTRVAVIPAGVDMRIIPPYSPSEPKGYRLQLSNDRPSGVRALLFLLYGSGDIAKNSVAGYMTDNPKLGMKWAVAGRMEGGKRKSRRNKRTKRKVMKKQRKSIHRKRNKFRTNKRTKKKVMKKKRTSIHLKRKQRKSKNTTRKH